MTDYLRVTDGRTPPVHYSIVAESFDEKAHKVIDNNDADDQAMDPLTGGPMPPKFLSSNHGQQADTTKES